MAEFCGLDLGTTFGRHPRECFDIPRKRTADESLKEFHALLTLRPDIDCDGTNDAVIRRFLLARKNRVEESFNLFVNYHLFRKRNPEIFDRFNALDVLIQQALRDGFPGVLNQRDRKGRTVLVFIASRWNYNCYSLATIYRSLLLTLENLIEDQLNQIRGFVVIVDWTEFSFKNSLNLNPRTLKTMIEGLQDCFPARIKGVHFIGQPWYVEAVLALIKPFLKDKSREKEEWDFHPSVALFGKSSHAWRMTEVFDHGMIHLHGNNLSTLHEHVTPDILPPEFGGEGPALNPMLWTQKLIDSAIENSNELDMYMNPDS